VADQDRGRERAAAGLVEQPWPLRFDQRLQFLLERVDLEREFPDLRNQLAGDPRSDGRRQPPQPSVGPVELAGERERAWFQRRLELRAQRDEMAAEPGLHASPLSDKVLAMVRQQPDFHRLLVQIGNRELVDPVLDDRAGDRERIDLIGLPRSPLTAARGAHPMRSDTNDPLPGRQQRLLEPMRDLAAVLDRPDPLAVQLARPLQRGQMPVVCGLDLALAAHSAGSVIDGCQRVRPLVRVRPNHDH
jgi:hypothetical protein